MATYQIKALHPELTDEAWQELYSYRKQYADFKNDFVEYESWKSLKDQYLNYLNKGVGIFVLWKDGEEFGYLNFIPRKRKKEELIFLRYNLRQTYIDEDLLETILTIYLKYYTTSSHLVLSSTDAKNDYLEEILTLEISETRELFELEIEKVNKKVLLNWNNSYNEYKQEFEVTLVHEVPPDLLEEFCRVSSILINDVRDKSRLFENVVLPKEQLINRQDIYKKSGVVQFLFLIFAKQEKKLVGYTDLTIKPSLPRIATQNMTGVLEEYRGKGLGKLLKALMLDKLMERFPGLTYVQTGIHPNNERSQKLNRKLGFQEIGKYKEYILRKWDVVSYLNANGT